MAMTSDPIQRFIVLAYDRSGSTLLVNYLNSHANIQCFHEPFNRRIWKDLVRYYGSIPQALSAHYDHERIAENLRVREIAAKRSMLKKRLLLGAKKLFKQSGHPNPRPSGENDDNESAISAIGLKVTTIQVFKAIPDLWRHICADFPDKIIVLNRSSLIDRFLSCQFALRTGIWRSTTPLQRDDTPITVQFDDFCAFADEEQAFAKKIDEEIANTRAQWLKVSYEDLVASRKATLAEVFAFLDLQSPQKLDGKLAKLARGSAESRISNYAELAKLAQGTIYEQYLA